MIKFFLGNYFIIWPPIFFAAVIMLIISANYFFKGRKFLANLYIDILTYKKLIVGTLIFGFLYNLFLSILQYNIWHSSALGKYFFPPFQSRFYYFHYAFTHFWLSGAISLATALLFWLILKAVKKYKGELLDNDEVDLGLLVFLLAGWPKCIFFVPIFFLVFLVFSVFNLLLLKQERTTIRLPFILAFAITFILGAYLLRIFGLANLMVISP